MWSNNLFIKNVSIISFCLKCIGLFCIFCLIFLSGVKYHISSFFIVGACDRGNSSVDQIHICPYCNYSNASEMQIRAHVLSQHSQRPREFLCPLCQENFGEKMKLEQHLVKVHNVSTEAMQRLLVMVDQPDWQQGQTRSPSSSATTPNDHDDATEVKSDLSESEAARLATDDGRLTWVLQNWGRQGCDWMVESLLRKWGR